MSNSTRINSENLNVGSLPNPPNIGYYDQDTSDKINSSSTLKDNLTKTCSNIGSSGIYDSGLETVYQKTIDGTLDDSMPIDNAQNTKNQIKHLSCQLASSRNRIYESSKLDILNPGMTVKKVFETFSNLKTYLILLFILTIYFLTSGFFSSFDVCANIFNLIENNYSRSIFYWIALLIGLIVPVIILSFLFVTTVCGSISSLEKINITESPTGEKDSIPDGFKRLDTGILILFVLFVYGFVAILFTIKKESLGNTIYMILISTILFVISIFLYLFYTFIPFFATANIDKVNEFKQDLKLYVDQQQNISNITTNQTQIKNVQRVFGLTSALIFIFFVIYMMLGKSFNNSTNSVVKDIFNGFFGASAVLIIPIFWILNFILATKFFYIYPVILLGSRFIRYIGMLVLFILYTKSGTFKDSMTDGLKDQLENFKEYTPTWNLIGMDVLKAILNLLGYENIFSKDVTNSNNNSTNLSKNKYVTPGIFSYFGSTMTGNSNDNDSSKLIVQVIILVITIIISMVLLYGVYKING